ncbi:MAG: 6-aminohexanoate-cyclic-dimer hydrolase [Acidimicrobiales bacterium]|nr:MAG: 6-aminohexanoate-cyclic-dimer hydrolase [Acidimicrobiales bacterium]
MSSTESREWLAFADAVETARAIRGGEISKREAVEAAVERIESINSTLNAVIHPRFEEALDEAERAEGPFAGVPIVLKDLDGFSAGDPYSAGCSALKDAGYRAPFDSHVTARLKRAGFVVVGRTNTPELGLQPTTEPLAFGPSRNPWNLGHSTGGSSGGSAAAVASGMVPVATGGDGGGSIRIPASECGLVGLKTTRGRISLGPELGEAWMGMVVRGHLTRSVRDTAAVLDILAGPEPGDPYTAPPSSRPYSEEVEAAGEPLRVGWAVRAADPSVVVHPECAEAVSSAVRLLEELGHHVLDDRPACFEDAEEAASLAAHFTNVYTASTARELDRLGELLGRPLSKDDVEESTWMTAEMGRAVTSAALLASSEWLSSFSRRMARWWEGADVLVTPTITEPPPPLGSFAPTPENPLAGMIRSAALVQFTVPFNVTGQPAISLPLHWTEDGLPVGVQFVAAFGREDLLIRLAARLEEARPWRNRRPPHHA